MSTLLDENVGPRYFHQVWRCKLPTRSDRHRDFSGSCCVATSHQLSHVSRVVLGTIGCLSSQVHHQNIGPFSGGGGGISMADVGKHNTKTDCWVVVDGQASGAEGASTSGVCRKIVYISKRKPWD